MGSIKGIIHQINEEKQVTEKFKKREFVVYIPGNSYRDRYVKFSLIQSDCDMIDNFEEGDTVEVSYSFEGREWKNPKTDELEYFNDVRASRIIPQEEKDVQVTDISGDGEDLPF